MTQTASKISASSSSMSASFDDWYGGAAKLTLGSRLSFEQECDEQDFMAYKDAHQNRPMLRKVALGMLFGYVAYGCFGGTLNDTFAPSSNALDLAWLCSWVTSFLISCVVPGVVATVGVGQICKLDAIIISLMSIYFFCAVLCSAWRLGVVFGQGGRDMYPDDYSYQIGDTTLILQLCFLISCNLIFSLRFRRCMMPMLILPFAYLGVSVHSNLHPEGPVSACTHTLLLFVLDVLTLLATYRAEVSDRESWARIMWQKESLEKANLEIARERHEKQLQEQYEKLITKAKYVSAREVYEKGMRLAQVIQDPTLSLTEFHQKIHDAYVELTYFGSLDGIEALDEKGQPGSEEYQRTINAFDNVYHMLRLHLDGAASGKFSFVFGDSYDECLKRRRIQLSNAGATTAADPAHKWDDQQWRFLEEFDSCGGWQLMSEIVTAAGMRHSDDDVVAALAFAAIHDIFKIQMLKPPNEADHDVALQGVLEGTDKRSWLVPAFLGLPHDSKILLISSTQGYNHGWFVQAETSVAIALPESSMFKDKKVMAFYALHWISDVGGSNPANPGGSSAWLLWSRFGAKTFMPMLEAFYTLLTNVATGRSQAYLSWIQHCFATYLPGRDLPNGIDAIARMRFAAMSQDLASVCEEAWCNCLDDEDKVVLSFEMALTGIRDEPFRDYATHNIGPAFSIKFIPQYMREHLSEGAEEGALALRNIAAILRMLRKEHPLAAERAGLNVSAILRAVGKINGSYQPAVEEEFSLRTVNAMEYEVVHGDLKLSSTSSLRSASAKLSADKADSIKEPSTVQLPFQELGTVRSV